MGSATFGGTHEPLKSTSMRHKYSTIFGMSSENVPNRHVSWLWPRRYRPPKSSVGFLPGPILHLSLRRRWWFRGVRSTSQFCPSAMCLEKRVLSKCHFVTPRFVSLFKLNRSKTGPVAVTFRRRPQGKSVIHPRRANLERG